MYLLIIYSKLDAITIFKWIFSDYFDMENSFVQAIPVEHQFEFIKMHSNSVIHYFSMIFHTNET